MSQNYVVLGRAEEAAAEKDLPSASKANREFHKEKRSNATHESMADPEARLYKKGDGQPETLCYMGHALMENDLDGAGRDNFGALTM